MPQRTASRRLLVGGTSTALLLGVVGFVPLLGSAAAAGCPSWTDPKGDSGFNASDPSGASGDDDLDIVSTVVRVTPTGGLDVVLAVAGLKEVGPDYAAGDEYVVNFDAAGTAASVTITRDTFVSGEEAATFEGAASATGKATFDLKTSTVTGSFTADQVKTALGKAVAGLKLSGFESLSYGYTQTPAGPALGFPLYDESAAPAALAYTDAGGCSGGAAPAPAPSGSATPTPTPSGSATPTPTPSGTASPSPTPTSSIGPDGLFTQPRKGCAEFTDPADDADPTGIGFFAEGSLDVTQVNLKSPANALQLFVKLTEADQALLDIWSGRVYDVAFTVNGKAVALSAPGDGPATATVGGTDNKDLKATAKVDAAASNIVFTVPLDGLSKAVGAAVRAGTAITATTVTTSADSELGAFEADSATGTKPEEKTYTYGDNTCFKPAPGTLVIDADPRGQYTDTTVLFATLKDADDTPVAGARVIAALTGGRVVAARTDAEGVADIALPIGVPAGTKVLTVAFGGTSEVGATKATRSFTVLAERTALRVSGTRGGVQAVLVDDDRSPRPVAGQLVTFTVGSKRYNVRTDSRGVAVLSRLAAGTVVKVSYAGSRGYYLEASTVTTRAR